ncbi:MAG: PilZ domain-containing protein [Myxococcota bacterium]
MTEERRRAVRFGIWFPMQLTNEGDVVLAVSRDVSEVGVMLVSAASMDVGSSVEVTMALPNDDEGERTVKGRVVRVEPNDEDQEGVWRHRVAVEFDERIDELEPFLEEVSRMSQPPPAP